MVSENSDSRRQGQTGSAVFLSYTLDSLSSKIQNATYSFVPIHKYIEARRRFRLTKPIP